jgi:hypothetical protein
MESLSNKELKIIRWFDNYFSNNKPIEPPYPYEQELEPYGPNPTDLDKINSLMEKLELDTIMNKIQW